MSRINVGIVGYGNSAKVYNLPYLLPHPEYQVYAFLQRSAAPSDLASAKPGSHCTVDFPQAKHYRTSDEFFADANIKLVIVCTQFDTHAEFAEKALNANKHVLVEKPFTTSSKEADKLIALAKEKGKILTVYQSKVLPVIASYDGLLTLAKIDRRWDGDFLTLEHILDKGALGTVTEAEIHYDFENPPWVSSMAAKGYTPGDGNMFGLGSHTIDQALVLFGRPKSVIGIMTVLRGIESETEDSFTLILQYDSPLLVTVKTTIVTPMVNQPKYLIRGTKGSYLKFGTDVQEDQILSGIQSTSAEFGIGDSTDDGILTTYDEFDGTYQTYNSKAKKFSGKYPTLPGRNRGYYENLADVLRGRSDLKVQPQQSRDGIRLMELARESYLTGKTVLWS
ncbi:oxidoreductase [Penicillium waksmanii]|uniref:oxidoreductase n=1 Tax=Penicillium waksmanii TaxID=69791 RepID=UPI0025491A17|nr:oxidoreductase [Penicillium waksmanii]KAJ5963119.1 oxidoreductase [Penicillium waksmanii]